MAANLLYFDGPEDLLRWLRALQAKGSMQRVLDLIRLANKVTVTAEGHLKFYPDGIAVQGG